MGLFGLIAEVVTAPVKVVGGTAKVVNKTVNNIGDEIDSWF